MKRNLPFLKHISDEIDFLIKETETLAYEQFISNGLLKRAVARSFEIIGEAAKNISDEFKARHKDIDWKKLAGMRDKIIHQYFGVDYDLVWETIKDKLPSLKEKIEKAIKGKEA